MKIIGESMKAEELKLGELFISAYVEGPEYDSNGAEHWEKSGLALIGEKVYIRTKTLCPEDQKGELVYRVRIE